MNKPIYIIPAGVMTDAAARAMGCMPVDLKDSDTPRTDAAFKEVEPMLTFASQRKRIFERMAQMERELTKANMEAKELRLSSDGHEYEAGLFRSSCNKLGHEIERKDKALRAAYAYVEMTAGNCVLLTLIRESITREASA